MVLFCFATLVIANQVWKTCSTLSSFMCLRIKYLKHIISAELAFPQSRRKLQVDVLKEAELKTFSWNDENDSNDKLLQSLACLDLILTGDEWPLVWAEALGNTTCGDDLIKFIVSKLKVNDQQMKKTIQMFCTEEGGEMGLPEAKQDNVDKLTSPFKSTMYSIRESMTLLETDKLS